METVARQTSPMIGRDRELAALCDMVAAAGRGEPGVAVIAGDAGVGKSRLVAELCTRMRASGATVLAGHCVNLPDGGLPYLPFVDAFRQLDTPAWHWLEPHLRGGAAETLGQLQLYEAVVELLFELSEQSPVCLVVEDLHWADRPSRDLLRYLIGRLERERLGLVLTYRSDDLHRRHPLRPFLADIARMPAVQRIGLEPLPAAAIEELVSAEGPVDPCVLSDIVARAEGNAFFAEELLEAGRASGDGGSLPEALRDVLITRLEQLDSSAARVVGVAAVAGRRVGHEVLAAVTGLPDAELDAALREAVARHVLEPDAESGTYEFRHALMQEAAYSDLLPGERVRLHREYAQVLQGLLESTPAVAAELAHHAEVSHDLPLALAASVRAARHARAVHAPSEAQRHLERALEWWCSIPDAAERTGMSESELYRQAAEAAGAAGDPVRAAALVQGADERLVAEIGPDPGPADRERLAVMRAHLAVARYYIGDMRDEQAAREATELIGSLPVSAARAEVRATEAFMMFVHGSDGAGELAERALADAVAVGADNVQAEALVTLARVAERRGDADTAAAHFTRALELARSSGDVAAELRCLFNLATSRYDAGDLPATLHWTQRSIERAAASGMRYSDYAREARGIDVIARYVSGDWDTSLRGAVLDADRTPANARPLLEAFILHIAVGRGMADVPDRIDRLLRINHPDPFANAQLVMLAGGCQIDHLTWQQDYQGAQAAYRRVIEVPVRLWGEHYLGRIWLDALALAALAERASLARLRGDADSAQVLSELASEGEALVEDARGTAKHGVPRGGRLGVEGVAWLARAEAEWSRLLGENDDTVWRATVAAFDYGYRYEVARSRWRLAEVLITRAANGQGSSRDGADSADAAEEAAELLRSAHQDAQALGAAPLAEAVAALARRAKITGVGRTSSVTLLTTREQEVLGLLARGRTNRQLGKELFISEKTASVHVSNILAKLEAGSRGEAVAIARQRGLI
jgi:DNA-binding CsgD family transcriptional regulator